MVYWCRVCLNWWMEVGLYCVGSIQLSLGKAFTSRQLWMTRRCSGFPSPMPTSLHFTHGQIHQLTFNYHESLSGFEMIILIWNALGYFIALDLLMEPALFNEASSRKSNDG